MPNYSTSLTVSNLRVETSVPKDSTAWRKANSLFYPVGPGYSEAWLVVSYRVLQTLTNAANINAAHTIQWGVSTNPNNSSSPITTTYSFPGWRFIHAETVLQGYARQAGALYLCCFRDIRYLASINSDSGTVRTNIRSYAQENPYLTGTTGYTWTSYITELWSNVGTLGAFPGMPAGLPIDSVPETQFFTGHNGWAVLNAVLEYLDCAISPNPLLGTFSIVQLGKPQTLPNNLPTPIQNFEPVTSNVDCAATLKFYFNKHYKNYGQEKDTELVDNWAYNGWGSTSSQATNITGAIGIKPIWQDMPIVIGIDGTDENTADRATRITNATSRYVTRYTCSLYHRIYSAIRSDVLPGGTIKAILFRNWDDGEGLNDFGGTVTEWIAKPEYVRNMDEFKEGCLTNSEQVTNITTAKSNILPPDLGQHSYPNYPRLPNIVQVYHSGASAGDYVEPNASNLHPGRVKRVTNQVMTTYEDCWILFVNDYDNLAGDFRAIDGEYYYGRLTGQASHAGTKLPLYVVATWEEFLMARAELYENLCGEVGQVDIVNFRLLSGRNLPVDPVVATNPFRHRGMTGDDLLLVYDKVVDSWLIIDVEKHAYKVYTDLRHVGWCHEWCIEGLAVTAALEVCSAPAWETIYCDPCTTMPSTSTSGEFVPIQTSLSMSVPSYGCCTDYTHVRSLGISVTNELGFILPTTGQDDLFVTVTDTFSHGYYDNSGGVYTYPDPNNPNYYIYLETPRSANVNSGAAPLVATIQGTRTTHPLDPNGPYIYPVGESWIPTCVRRTDPYTGVLLFPDDPSQREWVLIGKWGINEQSPSYIGTMYIYETGIAVMQYPYGLQTIRFPITGSFTVHSCNPFHATASFSLPRTFTYPEGATLDTWYPWFTPPPDTGDPFSANIEITE